MWRLPDRPPSTSRSLRPLWPIVGAAAAVVLALGFGTLGRWIGAAILLALAPPLVQPLARFPAARRVIRLLPQISIVALTVGLLWELVLGHTPASRDHAIHYFQTWILVDEMIPSGRLIGWSERFNNGYPFGDSYPVLGYVWMAAAHLLSFGLVPLRVSYAWGVLAMWALALWGVWSLARHMQAELGAEDDPPSNAPAWAACIGAGLWLLDPGGSRQGGWNYLMFHGVWPQLLSSALWIASLPLCWRALSRPSPRAIAVAAGVLSLSVLAHPFGMLTAAASFGMWPVALWLSGAVGRLPTGLWRVWLAIHAVAALLCAGSVVGFLASAGFMSRNPVPWAPLGTLATDLALGELFMGHRAWVGPLALVGVFVAIRAGRTFAWLALGLLGGMLVLASDASIVALRLDLLVAGFKNLQFPRYALALKPLYFALAGVGAVALARGAMALARSRESRRPGVERLAMAALAAPLLVALVDDAGRLLPRPVGGIETLERSSRADAERALAEALNAEREALGKAPMRVAFLRDGMGGGTYPIFAITDAGADVVLDGHVPAVNFRHRIRHRTPPGLRRLGVTHVVYDRDITDSDPQLATALETIDTYGDYTLARLPADETPAIVEIKGRKRTATVVERDAHRLVVDVTGIDPGGEPIAVTFVQAPYRKWTADIDGELLEIEPAARHGRTFVGTRVHAPRSGRITLRYEGSPAERAAWWVSLVALVLTLAALASGRQLVLARRLHSPAALRISWGLTAASVVVALALVVRSQRAQLEHTWATAIEQAVEDELVPEGVAFVHDAAIDGRARLVRVPQRVCEGIMGKDALSGCTEAEGRLRTRMLYHAPYIYRCLDVVVPGGGSAALTFSSVDEDAGMLGMLKRQGGRGKAQKLYWAVVRGDAELDELPGTVGTRVREFYVEPGHGETVTVHVINQGRKLEHVCISAAQVR